MSSFSIIFIIVIILAVIIYLIMDYYGPSRILLKPEHVFGLVCLRARDLIVQGCDSNGNLWASRGMIIYRLEKADNKFIKIAHVPCGFSVFWLNNFRIFRRMTLKPEIIETVVTSDGKICALSAGFMWYGETKRGKLKRTLKLPHYGLGIGRGFLANGLLLINDKVVFFGEYFRNKEKTYVRIYKSDDQGQTWDISNEFEPGITRHIHALQVDPYTGKLWICTGDSDKESMIGWSDDAYKKISIIGQGSDIWRSCHLVFTKEAVYWGTDSSSKDLTGIYRWDKTSGKLVRLLRSDGAVFYGTRLANGTIVMSTDREGFSCEKDDKTRLFIIKKDDKITTIPCGTWNYKKPGLRFSFAQLRFQRNQDYHSLVMTCLNQKEITDGDLLIVSAESLNKL
jgi:hypothetical protein